MSIISGYQKIKKMIKTASGYQLLSHWTSSNTVEMDDGSTLEQRISNIDNTSDQDKPVSTAQQNALDQKADIANPVLTGTPTAPTPETGTNTTQIATTEFVQTAVSNGTDGIITEINNEDAYINCDRSEKVVTITHKDASRINTSSTVTPSAGDTFTAVKSISSDTKGHVIGVETETVTLPSLDATDLGFVSTNASQGLSDTEKANARANIGAGTSSFSGSYTDLTNKPSIPTALPANGGNADTVDNLHASSFMGNGTGRIVPSWNGGDANGITYEYHGFVFNMKNVPSGQDWGFLDVSFFDGSGFAPSPPGHGVIRQIYTSYNTPTMWIRNRILFNGGDTWTAWRCVSNDGNANSAFSVSDRKNGTATYLNYGENCVENPTYLAAWNGYELRAFNKANVADLIGALKLSGGKMTGDLSFGDSGTISSKDKLILTVGDNANVRLWRDGFASFSPSNSGGVWLGSSNFKWGQIYSTNSVISTSDRNEKYDISYIGHNSKYDTQLSEEQLEQFVMGLLPCVYKFVDGESGRPHHGLIAQDIEELMNKIGLSDHAAFIKSPKTKEVEVEKEIEEEEVDPDTGKKKVIKKIMKELRYEEIPGEYIYSLRYEEFIADIIRFIQIQNNRIYILEEKLEVSEQKVENLEKRIEKLEKILIRQ